MNRRNVLVALGAAAILTGIVFGTGAFTQVEADRTVSVDLADDANAFLELSETDENPEYVSTVDGGAGQDVVQLNLDGSAAQGDGLNDDAVTLINPVLNVTNQGTQDVTVSFDTDGTADGIALVDENGDELDGNPLEGVSVGDTEQVGIKVAVGDADDVNGGTLDDDTDLTLTITATAE